jgi:hypothetical protein
MFYYVGLFLLAWLAMGFLTGIKLLYVDKKLTDDAIGEMYENATTDGERRVATLLSSKRYVLTLSTLLGFVAFGFDTYGTLQEARNAVRNFFNKHKN